ncbi:LOW QUALITY PROTEIN: pentatricopeptide repeat-containing protein At1g18485 [Salvia hispanica]|uniref:LOW QUALITY PROTEIN: pentatricopeptide repeat-containing protein At1g18485 n=1 Tax=Salvia hispanica TaxID=49212 RepID=UPI0020098140|nr:LOW QUALITY PROTEIN: pentatricopeptide repeat-containing protein At1g18485 [Salvia hispanica]
MLFHHSHFLHTHTHTFLRRLSILSPSTPQCPNLLPLLAASRSLPSTQRLHALALLHGLLPSSVSLAAALILSYAAHASSPSSLLSLFSPSAPFSTSSFLHNTLIRASTLLPAASHLGFAAYNHLLAATPFSPDDYTFPFALKLCADSRRVSKGMEIHARLIKAGLDGDLFVNNTLILFYGSYGELRSADKVFDEMPVRDLISWNTVIRVFSDDNCFSKSIGLFRDMFQSAFLPNVISVVSVLPACAALEDERFVRLIHCYAIKACLGGETKVGNALVDAYGKCGNVRASERVFREMDERNEVSWNSIIGGFSYRGLTREALDCFRSMLVEGVRLNTVTIATILPLISELNLFDEGSQLHGFSVKSNMDCDVFVANALIDMYGKWKRMSEAWEVFYAVDARNIVSWNTMIGNLTQNGLATEAIELVREMQARGEVPNSITLTNVLPACGRVGSLRRGRELHARCVRFGQVYELFSLNALTDMYAKCGRLDLAQAMFDISPRDEVSYNILIAGYSQTSQSSKSITLFREMEMVGMSHDTVSYTGVLAACANMSASEAGRQIHALAVIRTFDKHLFVANSLLDMYTKCGRIDIAMKVFDRIPVKDTASWNTVILGFGMLGEFETAVELFKSMKEDGVRHDSVSYIAVLSACSHGGLVGTGREIFDDMLAQGVAPSEMHYSCVVDLLGRNGLMEEAVGVVRGMPVEPGVNTWGALLGASRVHGNVEVGCWAAERLLELQPDHPGYYVVLSNMYAEAGRWDEADRVRKVMSLRRVKKKAGCSWVESEDQMHGFVAGDRFDPYLVFNE